MHKGLGFLCAFLLFPTTFSFAQNGKVENIGPLVDKSVPDAVRQVLDAKGYHVMLDDGSVACELWLRGTVPAQPKKDVQGALYTRLAESTMVGVLHFPEASTDYRGQPISAGFYSLRYELIPDDGNHLGAAPNRDFLLLIPVASDTDPNAALKFQELVSLSRKATGTKHPGPLNLVQAESGTAAAVSKDDQEHWIFSGGMKLSSGEEMPFALVVKGTAQQ
ncbi:MAG: hypothetical protein DMG73_05980 [Acidobacteria bacterium]|nr:MAG: hypothetical protein DMG73_05980 [Acidobacteriota bacterium]PYX66049.1 MAG: hypothetical protein DMG74_05715 [Acidobacteriota bacterium]